MSATKPAAAWPSSCTLTTSETTIARCKPTASASPRPREEGYGQVVVFYDLYGNKWDLVQPRQS